MFAGAEDAEILDRYQADRREITFELEKVLNLRPAQHLLREIQPACEFAKEGIEVAAYLGQSFHM